MKHKLLLLIALCSCIYVSAQTGFSCATPIVISGLPYATTDNTINYGDTTDVTPPYACLGSAGSYMSGNDVFYSYTPSSSGIINIRMSPTEPWSAIFVYDGCANVGVSCLAAVGNAQSTLREIPTLAVTASHNYIIVISTWATPQSTAYTLTVQNLNCAAPTQLAATNVGVSSAQLSWTENGTATAWEVAVEPAGAGVPSASGTSVSTNTSFTASGLTVGTAYEYWVRSSCGDGTFSFWSGPKLFHTAACDATSQCNLTFLMSDLYGDGWNGSTMSVIQNGYIAAVLGGSFNDGTSAAATVPLCDGVPFTLHWNSGGDYPDEVGITIVNSFGQSIYSYSGGTATPNSDLYTANVDCLTPLCQKPTGITVTGITWDGATFGWSEPGSATQWEVLALPYASPAPTASSTGTVIASNPYTVSGLSTGTAYNFYVRSICSSTSKSEWSSPKYFTPTCPAPHFLTVSSVTGTTASLGWTETGAATQWEVIILPSGSAPPAATTSGTVTTSNPYQAVGLTLGTTYKFYVRSSCSAASNSAWSVPHTFIPTESLPPLTTSTVQYTPQQLVSDVLVNNPCITITNVTSKTGSDFGTVNGIGSFTNTNPTFPISSGIVLSTGSVASIPGPNSTILSDGDNGLWPGDSNLETIISAATGQPMESQNATVLEFDFSTLNAFMSFNFLFASEEFGYYQCEYADAFAFLLTDLTSGVTTNLAVVPGTSNPVSVVTIRDNQYNTGCPSVNPGYFDGFFDGANQVASATNYNGQTALMTASSAIIPNHPYHIKLVVADRWDGLYDSAVFIEAGSFTAGPPECTDRLQLVAFVDSNGNGVKDNGETNFSYGSFTRQQNTDAVVNVTSPSGVYNIYGIGSPDTFTLGYTIDEEYATYYAVAPTNYTNIPIAAGSGTQTLYFPVTLTQPYNDVEVSMIPLSNPVPGFNFTTKVVYRNLGVAPVSGTLDFTKPGQVTINTVSQSGIVNSANGFSYSFMNLAPYESRSITVSMNVPAVPLVSLGDQLVSTAQISGTSNDINAANNTFTSTQAVVASFGPNGLTEIHGNTIPINSFAEDDYLYYTLRFQNTGTFNTNEIVVEDILNDAIDPSSIRMVAASHDYVMERTGSDIKWKMQYLNLPGALESDEMSKGFVSFKVQLRPGFSAGDMVANTGQVSFDASAAKSTNTFETYFTGDLGTTGFSGNAIMLYPNPATATVQLRLPASDTADLKMFDILGKVVAEWKAVGTEQKLDVSKLAAGVYLVEITRNHERSIVRLVKE